MSYRLIMYFLQANAEASIILFSSKKNQHDFSFGFWIKIHPVTKKGLWFLRFFVHHENLMTFNVPDNLHSPFGPVYTWY